ncbi:MAG: DUF1549 and DUF1553 domain-containing protein [Planctomycetota bacterium]|nr:DUF1549 and DUF1553 domain-containing protein [Planctomycetota bacterium]
MKHTFVSRIIIGSFALLSTVWAEQNPQNDISFRLDVMPILFRRGCNAGACHGSSRGKDGFRMSLFGYDPAGDYFRLTQEMIGRRINVASPKQSLMLLKATSKVPHTGGERLKEGSKDYETLLKWIMAGAPDDTEDVPEPVEISLSPDKMLFDGNSKATQTKVTARYSDGTIRDVTSLALFFSNNPSTAGIDEHGNVTPGKRGDTFIFARFNRFTIGSEVIVLPADTSYKWTNPPANNYIDELVYDRLQKLLLLPSELSDDETFLRRLYLDLTGQSPTVEQYSSFMKDTSSGKREALIKELLKSDEFTDVWTALWAESLRIMGGNYTPLATDVKAAKAYFDWIREQIAQDRPLNEFVADQVTANGNNLTDGPANLYTMLVQDVKFTPKSFASDFAQTFTGIRIQCAECHNHPFDRWTMDDYYGFVSFFTGIKRRQGSEPREYYIYNDIKAQPAKHLVDERPMPAKVLGGEAPAPTGIDQREVLAKWLTSPDNDLFKRNIANRIWAHFFGRGLVEPVDDMRVSNPPTNKPLLDALANRLADSKFSLRALVYDICSSRVYQLSAKPNHTNADDSRQFSRSRLRRLRADVLLDTIVRATDWNRGFGYFPPGTRAIQFYPLNVYSGTGDGFLLTFGRSKRASVCACETSSEPNLSQTLHLLVGNTLQGAVGGGGVVKKLLDKKTPPKELIEILYIRCLARKPSDEELTAMLDLIADKENDRSAYEDVFQGLLNSTEFNFNH